MLNLTATDREVTVMLTAAMLDTYASPAYAATFNAADRGKWGNSRTRADRRLRLWAYQGGVCVKCGGTMPTPGSVDLKDDTAPEIAHLVPATWHKEAAIAADGEAAWVANPWRGFIYGNVTVWHRKCNRSHGENIVRFEDLARPDLVFTGSTRDLPKV